jgi:L-threonylcarbamoyladenylate synthase
MTCVDRDIDEHITAAAGVLRNGGVVLHATEGVWGFSCDPMSAAGVHKILALKGRAANKGFILIAADANEFAAALAQLAPQHRQHVLASWPGAHTWILPDDHYPPVIRGFRDTVACRVPGHAQARALCAAFGGVLVSTSANQSGQPAISSYALARATFAEAVDYFLPGEVDNPGVPSTIHGLDGEILR